MDEENILGHLLKVEAEAAALVDDAQAEADRRVSEGEKQNRGLYDETYKARAAEAEAGYAKEVLSVRADYNVQLSAYKEGLDAMHQDQAGFSALTEKFLAGGV